MTAPESRIRWAAGSITPFNFTKAHMALSFDIGHVLALQLFLFADYFINGQFNSTSFGG